MQGPDRGGAAALRRMEWGGSHPLAPSPVGWRIRDEERGPKCPATLRHADTSAFPPFIKAAEQARVHDRNRPQNRE